jgi:dolichol kinase
VETSVALADLRALVLALDRPSEKNDPRALALRVRARLASLEDPDCPGWQAAAERAARAAGEVASAPPARFRALARELAACHEALRVAAGPEAARAAPRRITRHNPWRSAFHAAGGLAAALAARYLVDARGALAIALGASLVGVVLELGRRRVARFNGWFMQTRFVRAVARPDEHHRVSSSTWFAWGVLGAVLLTPPLAVQVGCVVLAVGDPAASLVGRRAGGPKLLEAKSLGGTGAFVLAGGLSALLFLLATSSLAPLIALRIALGAAGAGAAAELFSRRIDDNLTIPIAAALAACALL